MIQLLRWCKKLFGASCTTSPERTCSIIPVHFVKLNLDPHWPSFGSTKLHLQKKNECSFFKKEGAKHKF